MTSQEQPVQPVASGGVVVGKGLWADLQDDGCIVSAPARDRHRQRRILAEAQAWYLGEPIERRMCGCQLTGHESWCALAEAERIALHASATARDSGGHRILAAMQALAEAGLLHDIDGDDADQELPGLLDRLWDAELLGPSDAVVTIADAEAVAPGPSLWVLPPPEPYDGSDRCPACEGRKVTGERFLFPAADDNQAGKRLLVDQLCPGCGGCGRAVHTGCVPGDHADDDPDDVDTSEDHDGFACSSCGGRRWWICQGFAGDEVYHLRVACGCATDLLLRAAGGA